MEYEALRPTIDPQKTKKWFHCGPWTWMDRGYKTISGRSGPAVYTRDVTKWIELGFTFVHPDWYPLRKKI